MASGIATAGPRRDAVCRGPLARASVRTAELTGADHQRAFTVADSEQWLDGHPGGVFIVHGTWTVGATGPMVLPGDVAVIGELGRLGYRGQPGDWEAGITEYRRPEPTPR